MLLALVLPPVRQRHTLVRVDRFPIPLESMVLVDETSLQSLHESRATRDICKVFCALASLVDAMSLSVIAHDAN